MLNFYFTQTHLYNALDMTKEWMDYAKDRSKLTKIRSAPRHTIVYHKYLCQSDLQAKLAH